VTVPTYSAGDEARRSGVWLSRTVQVLTLFLVLRIVSLWFNATELFFDEAQYWVWAGEPAFGYYSKPPMLAWIIAAVTGVCGDSEFCIRLASPVLHTAAALIIYLIATFLFDPRIGFWSALFYATLPAVSLSSTLISTDVPLLFFWAAALYAFLRFEEADDLPWAFALGLALGGGLMSKYAMLYFLPCAAIYSLLVAERPHVFARGRFWLALAIAFACLLPNLVWNYANAFVTAAHTGDNIGWGGGFPHLQEFAEFFFSQFAVFGPILFGIYLAGIYRLPAEGMNRQQLFLLCFSVPVLLMICVQALMSKAYANWAAVTYVAATVLVVELMVNRIPDWWRKLSLPIHIGVFAVLGVAVIFSRPGQLPLPENFRPFARMQGAREIAAAARREIAQGQYAVLLSDDRRMSSLMGYYLRDLAISPRAWRWGETPSDHFELTRSYREEPGGPVFYMTQLRNPADIVGNFADVEFLGDIEPTAGEIRRVWFYRLVGYQEAGSSE
jgi:4-amino-4-deoxy-L-arabinose transferase-like glycosyltransferase